MSPPMRSCGRSGSPATPGSCTATAVDALRAFPIANARLAYQHYRQLTGSARWQALAAAGARPQRLLWASTGVKNPDDPPQKYVAAFAGSDIKGIRLRLNTIHETADGRRLLEQAARSLGLSARAYHRILRVARTVADLEGCAAALRQAAGLSTSGE